MDLASALPEEGRRANGKSTLTRIAAAELLQANGELTLTLTFDTTMSNLSVLDQLARAEKAIDATSQHCNVAVQVLAHSVGQGFAEMLQARRPEIEIKQIFRCKPCACLPNPGAKEKICFQLL